MALNCLVVDSPNPPTDVKLTGDKDGVILSWTNGYSEREPISGFMIQAKEEGIYSNF